MTLVEKISKTGLPLSQVAEKTGISLSTIRIALYGILNNEDKLRIINQELDGLINNHAHVLFS
jgi:hypothetical protein